MKISLSKRAKIILLVIHGIAIFAISYFAYGFFKYGEEYRRDLSYSYSRSLGELSENLNSIQNSLSQAQYVGTPTGIGFVSSALRSSSASAKTVISYLPFSESNSEDVEKILAVIEDFSNYVEKKVSSGEELDKDDYEGFKFLSSHILTVKNTFDSIIKNVGNGEADIGATRNLLQKTLGLGTLKQFDESLEELKGDVSLIDKPNYDGAFSPHLLTQEALFLENLDEISEEQAFEIASKFLEIDKENLTLSHENEQKIPCYVINSGNSSVKLTKQGGELLYFKESEKNLSTNLQYDDALEQANQQLAQLGYSNLVDVDQILGENSCIIKLCPTYNDIIYYSDMVIVTIELGEGGMIELDSSAFLMNNHSREELTPEISMEKAMESISKKLKVQKSNLCVIPSGGGNEILCYSFECVDTENSKKINLFINAKTGYEEKIIIK